MSKWCVRKKKRKEETLNCNHHKETRERLDLDQNLQSTSMTNEGKKIS